MKFINQQEKMEWLKATANKIAEMEQGRMIAVIKGDFDKAHSLLKGIKFARREFGSVSNSLKKGR